MSKKGGGGGGVKAVYQLPQPDPTKVKALSTGHNLFNANHMNELT